MQLLNTFKQKTPNEISLKSFSGTQVLHERCIISDYEFLTDRSQHQTNILNFYQARFELEKIL